MALFGSSVGYLVRRCDALEQRIAALERAMGAAGIAVPPPPAAPAAVDGVDAEIRDLVARGQKIQAIKLLRERTGVGLKEAKDVVDSL
jgi:large subunit ribosomal protein L7/L12